MIGLNECVSKSEAIQQVEAAIRRLALLHLSFSKTLVYEFGEERGKELILKSIMEFGRRAGERVKKGQLDLPKYGVYGRSENGKVYDCVLARVFKEYGEEGLGCLYCYVDAAKAMTADSSRKVVHKTCAACGDEFCTFEQMLTSEAERKDFEKSDKNWGKVDPRIAKEIGLKTH